MARNLLFFYCLFGWAICNLHSYETVDENSFSSSFENPSFAYPEAAEPSQPSSSFFGSSSFATNLFVRQNEGKGIGYNRGYATEGGQVLLIPQCSNFMPFIDVRGHRFDNRKYAANIGLGLRYALDTSCVVGANIYYDYRQYHHSKNFNQIGAGLEWLSPCLAFRVNGYFPVGERNRTYKTTFCRYRSGYFLEKRKIAHALRGIDAEVELLLIGCKKFSLYAAFGPYTLTQRSRKQEIDHVFGAQFRLEAFIGRYILVGGCITRDSIFHTRREGYVAFNLPINWGCCFNECCTVPDFLITPVRRREIIALHKQCRCKWNF